MKVCCNPKLVTQSSSPSKAVRAWRGRGRLVDEPWQMNVYVRCHCLGQWEFGYFALYVINAIVAFRTLICFKACKYNRTPFPWASEGNENRVPHSKKWHFSTSRGHAWVDQSKCCNSSADSELVSCQLKMNKTSKGGISISWAHPSSDIEKTQTTNGFLLDLLRSNFTPKESLYLTGGFSVVSLRGSINRAF